MTYEQFTFWLKGFLEDKITLDTHDIKLIQEKADDIKPSETKFITYTTETA